MDDERRTIMSGPPRQLTEELDGLAPTLIAAPVAGARYRLERVVGRGALFVTFRATRIDDQGAVPHAVKVLRPSLARAWPSGVRLLSREQARVLAILNERVPPSPHVVRLLEIGELTNVELPVPFLAFEWVEHDGVAPSLLARVRERMTSSGAALAPAECLRVLEGVMLGLDWVHQHGLLHRGLNASNVLLAGRTAKVTDTAIARPAGLPSTFGMQHASTAIASDAPYRAPEQNDPHAALTPACDVYAFGALVRFALTGRATDDVPLERAEALHPAFRTSAGALSSIENAIAMMRSEAPDARPPTLHSAWDLVAPSLRVLAARAGTPSVPTSRAPTTSNAWMWTERHRPRGALTFRIIAIDAEGNALASDGATLAYFDGRTHRSIDVPELVAIDAITSAGAGCFLVGGRTRTGAARLSLVSCEGTHALPLDASGSVVAAAIEGSDWLAIVRNGGRHFAIDARGRIPIEGVTRITHAARFDDDVWVVAGEGDAGFVATLEPNTRIVRPHATPLRRAPSALAARRGEVLLGGHHGVVVALRRAHGSSRLTATREQLPTTAAPSALAIDDRTLWCAAGNELFVRDDTGTRAPYRDDSTVEVIALGPSRRRMLAFLADGRVVEGRTLAE